MDIRKIMAASAAALALTACGQVTPPDPRVGNENIAPQPERVRAEVPDDTPATMLILGGYATKTDGYYNDHPPVFQPVSSVAEAEAYANAAQRMRSNDIGGDVMYQVLNGTTFVGSDTCDGVGFSTCNTTRVVLRAPQPAPVETPSP